jgi:hypothetical protein
MHYGYPDAIDPLAAAFPEQFVEYGLACLRWLDAQQARPKLIVPINEPSFFAYMADQGLWKPGVPGLKAQLLQAHLQFYQAAQTYLGETLAADLAQQRPPLLVGAIDPLLNPIAKEPADRAACAAAQFWAYHADDFLASVAAADAVDVIGLNVYREGQRYVWFEQGIRADTLIPAPAFYRPALSEQLIAKYHKFQHKPLLVAEVSERKCAAFGDAGDARAAWLAYVTEAALAARCAGVPILGVNYYPLVSIDWSESLACGPTLRTCDASLFTTWTDGAGVLHRAIDETMQTLLTCCESNFQQTVPRRLKLLLFEGEDENKLENV